MAKINYVHHSFDQELADQGKRRIQVPETVQLSNGDLATVYREKIVTAEEVEPLIMKKGKKMDTQPKEKVKRARRAVTKLSRVVEFVKTSDSKSKADLITGIVEMLEVTPSNANVYLYKALKEV